MRLRRYAGAIHSMPYPMPCRPVKLNFTIPTQTILSGSAQNVYENIVKTTCARVAMCGSIKPWRWGKLRMTLNESTIL